MFNTLKMRLYQGKQYISNVREAVLDKKFRGLPIIRGEQEQNYDCCVKLCPSSAISQNPLKIDLGKCIFCGDCERACKNGGINLTNFHKLSTTDRASLIIKEGDCIETFSKRAIQSQKKLRKIFGKSLKLRQVSAGGCNGCEMELNACSNVNFDMGRFGIEFVASPRHADGLVITGPITENMADALEDAYRCMPEPKMVVLAGSCAISSGIFQDSDAALNREFMEKYRIDLYVPGCPIHPLTFINGILDWLS